MALEAKGARCAVVFDCAPVRWVREHRINLLEGVIEVFGSEARANWNPASLLQPDCSGDLTQNQNLLL